MTVIIQVGIKTYFENKVLNNNLSQTSIQHNNELKFEKNIYVEQINNYKLSSLKHPFVYQSWNKLLRFINKKHHSQRGSCELTFII